MIRRIKACVLFLLLILLSFDAWAADELLFRIAPMKWPVALDEPVKFNAWVLNQTDHDIRIPSQLQNFVFPKAFDLLENFEPIYTLSIAVPTKEVDSVRLAPGAFYNGTLEHNAPMGGYYDYWFVLSIPKSDANPNLWSGSVVSNRQFIAPTFEPDPR